MKKRKQGPLKLGILLAIGALELGLVAVCLLLKNSDVSVLDPKGMVAHEQRSLIILSTLVMLVIAVPTLTMLYVFAWRYRDTNKKATYSPQKDHGKPFNVAIWALPTAFMLILASVMIPATHRLEPRKNINTGIKPLKIQVIALRWKWLFIYPEQNIATVNFVELPVGTPVEFDLTADETPMSSFWIPHLGGQLYAMTGHNNELNLLPETTGDYRGRTAEINGSGFAEMLFTARVGTQADFDTWVSDTQQSDGVLSPTEYQRLLKPTESEPVAYYSIVQADLYDTVLKKYGSHGHVGYQ